MPASLLDLAVETRLQIYEHLLHYGTPLARTNKTDLCLKLHQGYCDEHRCTYQSYDGTYANTAILLANKRIYLEAIEVFYALNTVVLKPEDFCDALRHGGDDMPFGHRDLVKRLILKDHHISASFSWLGTLYCSCGKKLFDNLTTLPRVQQVTLRVETSNASPVAMMVDKLRDTGPASTAIFTDVGRYEVSVPNLPAIIFEHRDIMTEWQFACTLPTTELNVRSYGDEESALGYSARRALWFTKQGGQWDTWSASTWGEAVSLESFHKKYPCLMHCDVLSLEFLTDMIHALALYIETSYGWS